MGTLGRTAEGVPPAISRRRLPRGGRGGRGAPNGAWACSSDSWSRVCRRRRSERGPLQRRPEDQLPGATHPTCLLLGVSLAQFYKWVRRQEPGPHTPSEQRRAEVDVAVETAFETAPCLHGSPRLHLDLREAGWVVSEKTVPVKERTRCVAKAWPGRQIKRRHGLTRRDITALKFPDLLCGDFTATRPNTRWAGDMTEIPPGAGTLNLATVIDLYSRRLLGAATGLGPDAELACQAVTMAVATRDPRRRRPGPASSSTPTSARPTPRTTSPTVPNVRHPPVHGAGGVVLR